MRFGAHAFVWVPDWSRKSAERAIREAAEVGLDFVEVPLLRLEDLDVGKTRALLNQYGLAVTCSLALPAQASLPDHPKAARAFLLRVLETAHRLGSPIVTGVTYGTLGKLPSHAPHPDELETVARTLKQVAREAASRGIHLGIEPVNRYETYLVNLAQQGLDLIKQIDEPNVFLHLDTYHMNIEEKGFKEPILRAGKLLQYIHLSESDRGTPGSGNVRWDEVFAALASIGYSGDLVMESFVAHNPDIARATCMWRPVVEDQAMLVRDGLAFLRGKAQAYGLVS